MNRRGAIMDSNIVKVNDIVKIINCITKEEIVVKILPSYTKVNYSTEKSDRYIKRVYKEIVSDGDGINSISELSLLGKNVIGKRLGQTFKYIDNEKSQQIFKVTAKINDSNWSVLKHNEDETQ